ncbi:MAG: hypothetical protein QMD80_01740 [archaeon]|nr:hypothetical protein [archaeon]
MQQIGHELGHQGMKDEEIISLLHQLRRPTFSLVIWISMTISYVTLAIAWFV